jgi:RNA polymerase sigma-70 factor (ECF subfamily)
VGRGASLVEIEAVYRRRSRDFFRLALARLGEPVLAQDAVQEGFARAIRARRTFRGESDLAGWIARCVLNAAADAAKRRPSLACAADPEPFDAEQPDVSELREAIRRLPTRQRDVLFLRFYADLDYRSIADVLEIEVGTVSATLHAARAALARTLEVDSDVAR